MNPVLIYVNALPIILGGLIGSFLNVVIARWPQEQSIIHPRSACPKCHNFIAWYDNIPVLSFLILRARCRQCKNPISFRYPAVEILTALLSWATFRHFVPNLDALNTPNLVAYLLYFYFVAGLVAITAIDLEHHLIPDMITLPAIPIALVGIWWLDQNGADVIEPRSALLGALIGPGVLALLRSYYEFIRGQEGMGEGDVKMLAMLGAFLGHHPALLFIIFISSMLGSVVGLLFMVIWRTDLKYALPYGPFLAIGGLIYLFFGNGSLEAIMPSLLR